MKSWAHRQISEITDTQSNTYVTDNARLWTSCSRVCTVQEIFFQHSRLYCSPFSCTFIFVSTGLVMLGLTLLLILKAAKPFSMLRFNRLCWWMISACSALKTKQWWLKNDWQLRYSTHVQASALLFTVVHLNSNEMRGYMNWNHGKC